MTKVCAVTGCGRPHLAKGLCSRHYQRKRAERRRGDGAPCSKCGGERGSYRQDAWCQPCRSASTLSWAERNPEKRRELARRSATVSHRRRRAEAIEAYGGACKCCGESEPAFLTIDHIDGGGNAHRRTLTADGSIAGSSNFYRWLKNQGWPEGFQLLCHNCNFAKSHGGCPHARRAHATADRLL